MADEFNVDELAFRKASDSFDWAEAREFELNLTRAMMSPEDLLRFGGEIDRTLALLAGEKSRLLGVMGKANDELSQCNSEEQGDFAHGRDRAAQYLAFR